MNKSKTEVIREVVRQIPRDKFNYLFLCNVIAAVFCNMAYWFIWRERPLLLLGGFFIFTLCHFIARGGGFLLLFIFLYGHKFDTYNPFFREKKWERRLYKIMGVKKWKRFFPTYYKKTKFDISPCFVHDKERLAHNMCLRELGHFIAMFSTLPSLSVILYVGFSVPVFTALLVLHILIVAYIDGTSIIIQRYNRPRVLALSAIQKNEKL